MKLNKKVLWLIGVATIFAMFFAVGCGNSGSGGNGDEGSSQSKQQWLTIATGGTGGVYYPYGGGMATVINQNIDNVNATAEVTQASVENTNMVDSGEAQLGLIMGDVGYQAYYGTGRFEGDKKNIRTIFMMYPNIYQIVTLDQSINSIYDIKGKRVSVGAPGSGTEYKTDLVFEELGISRDDFKVQQLPFADQSNSMRDGNLDVGVWSVAAPTSSITELTATHDINIIPFSKEDIAKVNQAFPFYNPGVIKGGTYPGVDEDIDTLSVWNIVIGNADYNEDLVYEIVKAIFENQQQLVDIHVAAEWTTPQNTLDNAFFPLHTGVIRYFEEIGLDIPDHLIPDEAK